MNLPFEEIITGDRVISLCDFVLATRENFNFHKNLDLFAKQIIIVRNEDFMMDITQINRIFSGYSDTIRLFIYTHCLLPFLKNLAPYLDDSKDYVLYVHNSDHSFDNSYQYLLRYKHIKKVYAQNILFDELHPKLSFLPMGIANCMWPHGNLPILYSVMNSRIEKEKGIYVNINPFTFPFRKQFLDKITEKNIYKISESKNYKEYLEDLASHKFCLCIRGNAVDTHRFWESLYLGVIPVIVNNKDTKCENFVRYLSETKLPFVEMKEESIDEILEMYPEKFFDEVLYNTILSSADFSALKLSEYIFH